MLKRFKIIDLDYLGYDIDQGEWLDIKKEKPNVKYGKYKVKLENGYEITAYFFLDKLIGFVTNPCYWWHGKEKTPLENKQIACWRNHNPTIHNIHYQT